MSEQQNIFSGKSEVLKDALNCFTNFWEVVASITDVSIPGVSCLLPILDLLLDNVDSKEAVFANEQFQKLNDHIEVISTEIRHINEEIKRRTIDVTYYQVERNLNNHFRHLMDISKVKDEEVKETREDMFIEHFKKTQGKKNLDILYKAVIGDKMFGASVLEVVLNYKQKNRRQVEQFCDMLKHLFGIGLIALLGHERLTSSGEEEILRQEWDDKMKEVQKKIDEVIAECISTFPTQAEQDAMYIVKKHSSKTNKELADLLMDHLKEKYYWVHWSIRVFNSPTGVFASKKNFHGLAGKSWFKVPVSDEILNVIISYSVSSETVNKARIKNLVLDLNKCICKRPSMAMLAEQLFKANPHCVVHTVKTSCKDFVFSCSFSDELQYCAKFKNFRVFLHSENREENKNEPGNC